MKEILSIVERALDDEISSIKHFRENLDNKGCSAPVKNEWIHTSS